MNIGILPILYLYNQVKKVLISVTEANVDKVQKNINQSTTQAIRTRPPSHRSHTVNSLTFLYASADWM